MIREARVRGGMERRRKARADALLKLRAAVLLLIEAGEHEPCAELSELVRRLEARPA